MFRHEIMFLINYFSWFLRLKKLKICVKLIENIINLSSGDHWAQIFKNKQVLPRLVLPHFMHTYWGKKNGDERSPRKEPLALLLILSLAKVQDQNEGLPVERQLIWGV